MSVPAVSIVVGFDLDMTLIDTVPGFGATLDALGSELGMVFPIGDLTSRLGPPLDLTLAPHLAPEEVTAMFNVREGLELKDLPPPKATELLVDVEVRLRPGQPHPAQGV